MSQQGRGPYDPADFERAVSELADKAYALALRITGSPQDAEDALQDAFLSAFRNLGSYRGEASFGTWLYRIVVNAALMRVRERRPVEYLEDEGTRAEFVPDFSGDLADPLLAIELREKLEEGILRLPPETRAVVVLRDIEGFSTPQACQILEITETALKSRLHRGRQMLRQYLQEYLERR